MDLNSRTQGTFFISSRKRKRSSVPLPANRGPAAAAEASTEDEDNLARKTLQKQSYNKNWGRCERKIESALDSLNEKTLVSIINFIKSSHPPNAFPSPFPSIPTALVFGSSMATASALLSKLFSSLSPQDDAMDQDDMRKYSKVLVDCRPNYNLDSLVRSIVMGLLSDQDVDFTVEPPTLPTLLSHLPTPSPILVVTLHQAHLLPTPLLPQLTHVLSRYRRLRLALVLTTAAAAGGREGLGGLEIKQFDLPVGAEVWEAVVEAAWFSLEGEEDGGLVGVDGDTLEELRVGFERVDGSLEGLISQIQYIHLKTHLSSPLGLFISPDPFSSGLISTSLHHALLSLPSVTRHSTNPALLCSFAPNAPTNAIPPPSQVASLLPAARAEFSSHWRGLAVGYHLLRSLKTFLAERKGEVVGRGSLGRLMRDCVRGEKGVGRLGNDEGWRWSVKLASKLPDSEALDLAERLGLVLEKAVGEDSEVDALANVLAEAATLGSGGAKMVALGMEALFSAKFVTPEKIVFHDIFTFHHLDDLIRVFHPSPLEAIQTALLSPHTYLGCSCCSPTSDSLPTSYPDTTLLFLRYLESGKLINLYDWFASFTSVLEADHQPDEKRKMMDGGLVGGVEEAQARFMRAFHELDFLGLLKGTKRREDCCLKTLFRLPEDEEEEEED